MKLKLFQIDAFANRLFHGNPAAVVPLETWLDDELMQAIAQENNLAETAFFVRADSGYQLRWFTPKHEVDLCGHATLAAAYVLYDMLGYDDTATLRFHTRSGELIVSRMGKAFTMNFPAQVPQPCESPALLAQALKITPVEVLRHDDWVVVLENEDAVRSLNPDFSLLKQLDLRGVAITARGNEVDFVSRFFAPKYGIDEDPVTGSAHCELAPYWSEKLDKATLKARQISPRGGELGCIYDRDRVTLIGTAVKYMEGDILI